MKADNAVAGRMHPLDASCLHSLSGIGVPWAECSRVRPFFALIFKKIIQVQQNENKR